MSQDSLANMTLPPPLVPLNKLKEQLDPVQPPILPCPAPAVEETKEPKGKKKERRMELAGLEAGDPLSTYHLLKLGFKNAVSIVPNLFKKYWKIILVVMLVWYALEAFDVFYLGRQYPAFMPVWLFIDKFLLIMVFFTASYNNFVAKAVYATIIIRVGLPLAGRVHSEGLTKVINDFKGIGPGFKDSWAKAGGVALGVLVSFTGIAAFLSNYLTRNNRIDKIAVCLALVMALMKALSDGPKSLPFMAGRVVMKDLFVMLLKPSPVQNHHIYVGVSGLTIGFLCSVPFAYFSKFTSDYIGYIVGGIAIVIGIILSLIKKNVARG